MGLYFFGGGGVVWVDFVRQRGACVFRVNTVVWVVEDILRRRVFGFLGCWGCSAEWI